ncbi:hypothetical protein VT84_30800 [Gemmata sp. SH-PL17]|uniref:hypothetical protein n=1 Tax=Gemmata sp. SH-PL17 TaxID=1630693 RepID=UPI00078E1500|nr:hypothetical protein [Gemmata sp. SH-PL17]AMV28823.1 hypothetical protein VT84_30800 [Gemmata sp. SH-PL17]
MPTLTITRASSTKHEVKLAADDGTILECYEANLLSPRAQAKLAATTGLTQAAIAKAATEVRDATRLPKAPRPAQQIPYTGPTTPEVAANAPFRIILRGIGEPKETGRTIEGQTPIEAFFRAFDALDYPVGDPLITWTGKDVVCCLDVDYHSGYKPTPETLEVRAAQLQPRPFAYHVSHGRGCKLFYVAADGYTAEELAAVGAICWLNQDRRATTDLITQSRHPGYASSNHGTKCGPVYTQTPGADVSPVSAWLRRSVDEQAVTDWLETRGWKLGDRLAHEECPIDPDTESSSDDPVQIQSGGIMCFRCQGKGLSCGRTPGFQPWASIVGGAPPKAVAMIVNAVHWQHARLVLRHEFPRLPESIARAAYTAAVKLQHGADSPQALAAGRAGADLIRMQGRWVSPDGNTTYTQHLSGMVNALPAVWVPGERTVMGDRRDLFLQAADLSKYGYFHVTPVHGCKIYGRHLDYPDGRIAFASPSRHFHSEGARRFAPHYRKPEDRMPLDAAWGVVEEAFPGIHHNYVYLLIALKGLAEGATVQAPFTIVTGPSGSGKSSTVHVAAGLCGDAASEPTYSADMVRLMQAVGEGLDAGSFVVLNEIFKEAAKARLKPRAAVDPILTMTPNSLSHRLYIGPRPLGRLPALVLTDIEIPAVVHSDVQLARRLVWVDLPSKVEWGQSLAKAGFGDMARFRLWKPEAAAAADAIVSDVTDRFFRDAWTVADVAKELGFGTLEDLGDCGTVRDSLRRFFKLVCDAPALTGSDADRYPAPGWKAIGRGDTSDLADLWNQLANGLQGDEWGESRIVTGEDWGRLLGKKESIKFDRAMYRNTLYVRFRIGQKMAPTWTSAESI